MVFHTGREHRVTLVPTVAVSWSPQLVHVREEADPRAVGSGADRDSAPAWNSVAREVAERLAKSHLRINVSMRKDRSQSCIDLDIEPWI